MIKGCKQFFKLKAIHDFDAFLNAVYIDCFVFSIKNMLKKHKIYILSRNVSMRICRPHLGK